jgi:hypothetical protein
MSVTQNWMSDVSLVLIWSTLSVTLPSQDSSLESIGLYEYEYWYHNFSFGKPTGSFLESPVELTVIACCNETNRSEYPFLDCHCFYRLNHG